MTGRAGGVDFLRSPMVRTRLVRARHLATALLGALFLAGGCGGDEPVPPRLPAARAGPAPAAEAGAEPPSLFPPRLPPETESIRAESARADAAGDDWESEKLHDRLRPALESFLRALLGARAEEARSLLDPAFEGSTELYPAALAEVYRSPSCRVSRPERIDAVLRPPTDFPELAAGLAGAFAPEPAEPPEPRFQIVSVEMGSPDGGALAVDTEVLIQIVQRSPARQLDARWRVGWAVPAQGAPRLRWLRLSSFSEVRGSASFVDLAPEVFGGNPCFEPEYMHGIDDYHMRLDRQAGQAFQGMQGVAVGDVDGDGLDDVYVPQQVGTVNRLFRHQEDGTALDVSVQAGVNFLDVTRSALLLDLDNDGDQDLAAAVANLVVVRYNDGRGAFPADGQVVLAGSGAEQFYSLSAADADGDGDLDLYGCRYSLGGVMHGAPVPYHDADNGASNYFWRNDLEDGGARRFADATEEAGFAANNRKFSLASLWEDFDGDGHLDLYVVNDFGRKNLWRNDGRGHFRDVAAELGVLDIGAGMGVTAADYDLDGDLDVYVSNMFSAPGLRIASQARFLGGVHRDVQAWYVKHASGNTLLRNDGIEGVGRFTDVSAASGTGLGRWAWGAKFTDFDGDGWADLFVPNGQTTSRRSDFDMEGYFWRRVVSQSPVDPSTAEGYRAAFEAIQHLVMFQGHAWNGRERDVAFLNLRDGTFADVSAVAGLDFEDDGRCAATLDWDGDGREDLLVRNRTAPRLRLFLNRDATPRSFAAFELVGRTCNRDAIGALVTVECAGRVLRKRLYAGEGYLCQSSKRLLFGLGGATRVERVSVDWPGGARDSWTDLAVDTVWRLEQGAAAPVARPLRAHALEPGPRGREPGGTVSRVVLAERLPMAPFPLPGFAAPDRTVRALAGGPALIVALTFEHPAGEAFLRGVRERAGAQANLRLVPMVADEGPARARARRRLEELDLAAHAGFLDGRSKLALEVATLEVLGFLDRAPMPVAWLLDAAGQACVMYVGAADPEVVARDVATVAAMPIDRGSTLKLSGGVWLVPRQRDFLVMSEVFHGAGFHDLSAHFRRWAEKLKRVPPAGGK